MAFLGPIFGVGVGFKDRFGVSSYRLIICFLSFALFLLYHVALSSCVWWVGSSQRLLSLNPTTVLVALFLGFWLLLGCDNKTVSNCFLDQEGIIVGIYMTFKVKIIKKFGLNLA